MGIIKDKLAWIIVVAVMVLFVIIRRDAFMSVGI